MIGPARGCNKQTRLRQQRRRRVDPDLRRPVVFATVRSCNRLHKSAAEFQGARNRDGNLSGRRNERALHRLDRRGPDGLRHGEAPAAGRLQSRRLQPHAQQGRAADAVRRDHRRFAGGARRPRHRLHHGFRRRGSARRRDRRARRALRQGQTASCWSIAPASPKPIHSLCASASRRSACRCSPRPSAATPRS